MNAVDLITVVKWEKGGKKGGVGMALGCLNAFQVWFYWVQVTSSPSLLSRPELRTSHSVQKHLSSSKHTRAAAQNQSQISSKGRLFLGPCFVQKNCWVKLNARAPCLLATVAFPGCRPSPVLPLPSPTGVLLLAF